MHRIFSCLRLPVSDPFVEYVIADHHFIISTGIYWLFRLIYEICLTLRTDKRKLKFLFGHPILPNRAWV